MASMIDLKKISYSGRISYKSSGYIWRPDLVSKYESLWMIISKFALLNYATLSDLKQVFQKPVKKGGTWDYDRYIFNAWSLNSLNKLSAKKLSSILILESGELRYALSTPYSIFLYPPFDKRKMDGNRSLPVGHLRFCPECMENGFHTALFQYRWMIKCPLHEIPLQSSCPKCNQSIGYRLMRDILINPIGCKCGYDLWHGKHQILHCDLAQNELETYIDKFLHWRDQLQSNHIFSLHRSGFYGRAKEGRPDPGQELSAVHLWENISNIAKPWPRNIFYSQHERIESVDYNRRVEVEFNDHYSTLSDYYLYRLSKITTLEEAQLQNDYTKDYLSVFKSFKRHLKDHVLRHHKSCIGDTLYTYSAIKSVQRVPIPCIYGFGYLMWVQFWENRLIEVDYHRQIEAPSKVVHEILRTRMRFVYLMESMFDEYWKPLGHQAKGRRELVKWLTLQVFRRCLVSTFDESLQIAKESARSERTSLTDWGIQERTNPVFCLYKRNEQNFRISWPTNTFLSNLRNKCLPVTRAHKSNVKEISLQSGLKAGKNFVRNYGYRFGEDYVDRVQNSLFRI